MGRYDALWQTKQSEEHSEDAKNTEQEASKPANKQPLSTTKPIYQAQKTVNKSDTTTSRHHDTARPSNRATSVSRNQDTIPFNQELIENLRLAVKQLGREQATYRLTIEEKKALKGIEFEYSNRDIRTTANELVRIAVNFLVEDYRANKEKSLLSRVLESLNK